MKKRLCQVAMPEYRDFNSFPRHSNEQKLLRLSTRAQRFSNFGWLNRKVSKRKSRPVCWLVRRKRKSSQLEWDR